MLPVRRMRGDWYDLNDQRTALVAERARPRLGDPITVGVRSVDARAAGSTSARGLGGPVSRRGHAKAPPRSGDVATNRQARFKFHLLETWETGVVLQGSEVKSLREGKVNLKDSYALVRDGEVWLHNRHIALASPRRARATTPSARASC